MLTAINGAAGSDVGGSLTSLVQGAAVNVLQGLATDQVKQLADALHSEEARAALQGLVGCAGSAAGGSGDCASGAMGAAASVVLNNLLASLDPKKADGSVAVNAEGDAVRTYTQAEQQARMRRAEGESDVLPAPGESRIAAIAVNLQDAGEVPEMGLGPFGLPVGGIDIGDHRRIDAAPWPIVAGIGP